MTELRAAIAAATQRLAAAGVASPRHDAEELAAHVLGCGRGDLLTRSDVPAVTAGAYEALVARRAAREPLQHLTGRAAFRHVELAVGPGVFVPRPETEVVAGAAITAAATVAAERPPIVVDLCTGSGAIALAVATEVPDAEVHAVEADPGAYDWAARNVAGSSVELHLGDAAGFAMRAPHLAGRVDVVVSNPPYIPHEAWESVEPEVRDHDPPAALWAADDGLAMIRAVATTAAELLRDGGLLVVEHADVQGAAAVAALVSTGVWTGVADHRDLAGRPRYVTGRRAGRRAPTATAPGVVR